MSRPQILNSQRCSNVPCDRIARWKCIGCEKVKYFELVLAIFQVKFQIRISIIKLRLFTVEKNVKKIIGVKDMKMSVRPISKGSCESPTVKYAYVRLFTVL